MLTRIVTTRRTKIKTVTRIVSFHGLYGSFIVFIERLRKKFGHRVELMLSKIKGGRTYAEFAVTI